MTAKNPEDTTTEQTPRFADWLAEHRNGLLDVELHEKLTEVVACVARTKKPGSVTLTLKVTPEGDMIAILDTVGHKAPEERDARLYWVGLDGTLTRNNPMQPRLLDD